MANLFWAGYALEDRYKTIQKVEQVVSRYGSVVDFKQFSDLAITLVIEIEERFIAQLYAALSSIIDLDVAESVSSTSQRERTLFLNITFGAGTGDLKTEVPAVPG